MSEPTLSDDIKKVAESIRAEMAAIRGICKKVGTRWQETSPSMSDIVLRHMSINAHLQRLEVIAAAKRMVGALEPTTAQQPVEDLELFRGGQECPRSLLLSSLHRANDHTLDVDDTSDRHVAVTSEEGGAHA